MTRHTARAAVLASYRHAGGRHWIGLTGSSMAPVIGEGASALVDFNARSPVVGDVVVAEVAGRVVAHRVVAAPTRRRPGRYLLKGDAEPFVDARVGGMNILGTVIAIRRPGRGPSRAGLSGRRARAIAITSRLSSRGLQAAKPLLSLLPPTRRRSAGRVLATVARTPVSILAITPRLGERIAFQPKGGDS